MSDERDDERYGLIKEIHAQVNRIAVNLEKAQITDFLRLLNSPWRLIYLNVLSGIARGVGIAIGLTVVAGTLLYFLQILGALDLPIIGGYIAEIVKIVRAQLEGAHTF